MMKVMHMIGSAKPGGAEMFAFRLLLALQARPDIEVLAVIRENSWMESLLRERGIPFKTVPFGGLLDVMTKLKVRKIAREFGPQIVMSWMNRASRFVPRGPWVAVGRLGGFSNLKYYHGKVTHLIGNTEDISAYCRKSGWPTDKVMTIPNFIPEPVKGWRHVRDAKRREMGYAEQDVVLMIAARIHAVKGVDLAIRALGNLPENFKLMIVGDGPQRAELEVLVYGLNLGDRVLWTGWQENVSPFAAVADMWLVPSRHEPLSNTCLEAWVHEVPVIAANTGGLAHMVEDGMTGLKIPVEDVESLRMAILRLANNSGLRTNLVNGGLAKFRKNYSEAVVVEQYLKYYKSLMSKKVSKV